MGVRTAGRMISRNLSRRLERLESHHAPASDPRVIEVQLISSVDRSVVDRLRFTVGGVVNRKAGGFRASR
jgi:hypothetical protein